MCSVVGIILKNPTQKDFDSIKRVFLESKIRGMHATGISYVKNNRVITEKHPVPADKFPWVFPSYVNEDGNVYLVGHCRYSTSDLEFNQPIANSTTAVAHNGVITQELPERWEELYGYKCKTKNDTELLLHTIEDNECPLTKWQNASLAVCELWFCKKLRFYRNGKRPIYFTLVENGVIITSTEDIIVRTKINGVTSIAPLGAYLLFDENLTMTVDNVTINNPDLQRVDYEIETISI